jgi:O-antigen/teichoic acid export membrane protein
MGGAFRHRAPESADEDLLAAVHFTLKSAFVLVWFAMLVAGGMIFTRGQSRLAFVVVAATGALSRLCHTPRLILTRRVMHRRIAMLQVADLLAGTLVAVILAWRGATLWALLAIDIVHALLQVLLMYVWRPVWRPRLAWSRPVAAYLVRFGSRNLVALFLARALDQVDDLWVGTFLGKTSLGYYSRAYAFASYPGKIVAQPIQEVAEGTYAELKGKRLALSRAFFRVNAMLVRSGFLLAGTLAAAAPELIRLFLGEKWVPMVGTFRLMMLFALLNPIKTTVGSLFVAVGEPEQLVKTRSLQLGVLVVGLFGLGYPLGNAGVALAVDVMLAVGIAALFSRAHAHVDFSVRGLLLVPALALVAGLGAAFLSAWLVVLPWSWLTAIVRMTCFVLPYGMVLFAAERRQSVEMATYVARQIEAKLPWKAVAR